MPQNATDHTTGGLDARQAAVIQRLALGDSVTAAANEAGVDRSTVHRWLRDDFEFQAAHNGIRRSIRREMASQLEALASRALGTVEKAIEDGDIRGALAILKGHGLLSGQLSSPRTESAAALAEEAEASRLNDELFRSLTVGIVQPGTAEGR